MAITFKSLLIVFSDTIHCPKKRLKFYWKALHNYSLLRLKLCKNVARKPNLKEIQKYHLK